MAFLMKAALTALFTSITLTSAFPSPVPAGGPQGPGPSYPIGTRLDFAILQPDGNDNFFCWAFPALHPPFQAPAYVNTSVVDPFEIVPFVTTNDTDAAGNTALTTEIEGHGLMIANGQVVLQRSATTQGWYVSGGYLKNCEAPNGLYFCSEPESTSNTTAAQGTIGVEDASHSHKGASAGACHDATFVAFPAAG